MRIGLHFWYYIIQKDDSHKINVEKCVFFAHQAKKLKSMEALAIFMVIKLLCAIVKVRSL